MYGGALANVSHKYEHRAVQRRISTAKKEKYLPWTPGFHTREPHSANRHHL